MLATTTQKKCMVHGLITPDEDGECPACWGAYIARVEREALQARYEQEQKAARVGMTACWHPDCGGSTFAFPGARLHYPGHDPENGPAHKTVAVYGFVVGCDPARCAKFSHATADVELTVGRQALGEGEG